MAFALQGAGSRVKLMLKFTDNDDQVTWREFTVDWNTDLTTTISDCVAIATIIQTITGMLCDLGHVTLDIVDAGAPVQEVTSTRSKDGLFTFALDTTGQGNSPYGNVRVPYISENYRVGATGTAHLQIDVADPDIVAFTDEFLAAGRLTLSDGQNSTGLTKAKIINVKVKTPG